MASFGFVRAVLALSLAVTASAVLAASTDTSPPDANAARVSPSTQGTQRQHVTLTRGGIANAHTVRINNVVGAHPALPGVLALQSSSAFVIEEGSSDVLFSRHADIAMPIASITKLMTSLVVLEANQDMDETISITTDDLDTEKGTSSRLKVGTELTRRDLMHIALMSSENRAAHALCRSYPGGLAACLQSMNIKALELGMTNTHFNDPTGLSSQNVASAEDLAKLLQAASQNPTIREFSTDRGYAVPVGRRLVAYHNTNNLVANPGWDIVVQKTGYIVEAGKCLVMKARIEGKAVLIVLLDSWGKYTRFGDANRIKKWMEANPGMITTESAGHLSGGGAVVPRVQS